MSVLSSIYNWFISFINNSVVQSIFEDILKAVIISFITGFILTNAFLKERKLGKSLGTIGITEARVADGRMSKKSQRLLFGKGINPKPDLIKICFLTGINFFLDYKNELEEILKYEEKDKKRVKIKVLLENVEEAEGIKNHWYGDDGIIVEDHINDLRDHYYDILVNNKPASFPERAFVMLNAKKYLDVDKDKSFSEIYDINNLKSNEEAIKERIKKDLEDPYPNKPHIPKYLGDHVSQVLYLKKVFKELSEKTNNQIELRHYMDEYRIPMTITHYNGENKKSFWYKLTSKVSQSEEKDDLIRLWTNFNAPYKETRESINVKAEKHENEEAQFVVDCDKSFDYLWNKYRK